MPASEGGGTALDDALPFLDRRRASIAIERVVGSVFRREEGRRSYGSAADHFRRSSTDRYGPLSPAGADCERDERSKDDAAGNDHALPHCLFLLSGLS